MVALVLMRLISIATARLRSIEQRETQRVVRRFIPSVATIVEDGNTIVSRNVCEVCPLVTAHLILCICIRTALNTAQSEVISSFRIADTQRELSLQQCILCTPIYLIINSYLIGKSTFVKVNILTNTRIAITFADAQRLAYSALFHELHVNILMDGQRFLIQCTLVDFPSGPSLRLTVVKHHQTDAASLCHQFLPHPLVKQRDNVSMLIHLQTVDTVFYALDMTGILFCRARCGRQAVNRHAHSRYCSFKEQLSVGCQLCLHPTATSIAHLIAASYRQVYLYKRGNGEALIIIYH